MEDRTKAVKKYNQLKVKYGLPALSELEGTFDFELEDTSGILRKLVMIIWEIIHRIRSNVESMLHPQRYCCMFETKFFDNKEKEKLFEAYSTIMENFWQLEKLYYLNEKGKAEALKKSFSLFKSLKTFVEEMSNKLSREWAKKEKKNEEERKYIT